MGYCWTHGYSRNLPHTSVSCVNNWTEGHQQNATHANRMEGTDRIWYIADRWTPPLGARRDGESSSYQLQYNDTFSSN
eukprot:scaffold155660_cov58-Attheya_sp.AAC.5